MFEKLMVFIVCIVVLAFIVLITYAALNSAADYNEDSIWEERKNNENI